MNTSKIRPFAEYIMILYFSGNISSTYYMGVLSYANASESILNSYCHVKFSSWSMTFNIKCEFQYKM